MSLRSVFAERAFVVQLGDVADGILEHAGGPARQIGVQIGTQLHEIPFRIVVIIAAEILRHVVITIVARLEGQFARDAQSARDEVEIDRNAGIRRGVHTRIFGVSRTVQDAVCRHGEGLHRRHAAVLGRRADHRRGLLENRTVNTFIGIAVPGQTVVAHIARNTGKGADVLGDVHVDLRTEVHPKAARSGRVFVGLLLQERSLVHEVDVRPDARALTAAAKADAQPLHRTEITHEVIIIIVVGIERIVARPDPGHLVGGEGSRPHRAVVLPRLITKRSVLIGRGLLGFAGDLLQGEIGRDPHVEGAGKPRFGIDHNHAVGAFQTVDGRGGSVFQEHDVVDLGGRQVFDVIILHDDAVHDEQRLRALGRGDSADIFVYARIARVRRVFERSQSQDLPFEQLTETCIGHVFELSAPNGRNRFAERSAAANHAVTVIQQVVLGRRIRAHRHLHIGRHGQRNIAVACRTETEARNIRPQFETAVQVGSSEYFPGRIGDLHLIKRLAGSVRNGPFGAHGSGIGSPNLLRHQDAARKGDEGREQ